MSRAMIELQLLNAALESKDTHFFERLAIDKSWFSAFRNAYQLITDHIDTHGEMPSLATVASQIEDFEYLEYESPETLRRKLGDLLAKQSLEEYLATVDTTRPYDEIAEMIASKTKELGAKFGAIHVCDSNWRTNGKDRYAAYLKRESNKHVLIPSGFTEINRALTGRDNGAFVSGDYIVIYGVTKRGKSHLARKLTTIAACRAGFNVLDICLENERDEIQFMLDSIEAADQEYRTIEFDGIKMRGGFDRKKLVFGYMDAEQREQYRDFTSQFNDQNTAYGNYIIKTFEDEDMDICDIRKIEALIDEYKADVVLVDPIYLTTFPRVHEKTPGGGAQAMSRALRRLATRKQVVIATTVQAAIDERETDDDNPELEVPSMSKVKSSKSLLEDGTITFGIDSNQSGKALIEIMLSRKGGAGHKVHLQYLPQFGIVRSLDEAIKRQMEMVNATKLF